MIGEDGTLLRFTAYRGILSVNSLMQASPSPNSGGRKIPAQIEPGHCPIPVVYRATIFCLFKTRSTLLFCRSCKTGRWTRKTLVRPVNVVRDMASSKTGALPGVHSANLSSCFLLDGHPQKGVVQSVPSLMDTRKRV